MPDAHCEKSSFVSVFSALLVRQWIHARQCRLCLLFSVLAVCGMVLGVWHAPIDLYGHPVPPDFANVVCLMCWFWFGPAAAGLGLLALGDLLTNSSVPEDHKRFTLVCVAAGAVVVMFLGLYFVYDTVRRSEIVF